jgi:hypothetical protein
MLKVPRSREILLKALYDEEREVRLQGLLALEQLDPEGVLELPSSTAWRRTARATASPARPSCCCRSAAPPRAGGAARVTTAKTAAPAAKATPPAAP